jgi:hypothetical protein
MNPQHPSEHNRSVVCGRYDEMSWIIYGPVTSDGLKEMIEHASMLLQDVQIENQEQKRLIQSINNKEEDVFAVLGSIIHSWFIDTFQRVEGAARLDIYDINAVFARSEKYILMENIAKLQSSSVRARILPQKTLFRECIRKHEIMSMYLVRKENPQEEFIVGWAFNLREYFR